MPRPQPQWHNFAGSIDEFRNRDAKTGLAQLVSQVIDKTNYRDALVKLYPDATERESRLASLEEIVNAAASYEKNRRAVVAARSVRILGRHAAERARRQR